MLRMRHQRGRQIMPGGRVRLRIRTAPAGRIVILFQCRADIPVSDATGFGTVVRIELATPATGQLVSNTRICVPNTSRRFSGKGFPLVSARRRIPRHAFALKKYFRATQGSKTSDKKHTLASLGHTEELRVQNSPRQAIPPPSHF